LQASSSSPSSSSARAGSGKVSHPAPLFLYLSHFLTGPRLLHPADSRGIYVPILLYGASTATTTLACVALILATPTAGTFAAAGVVSVTPVQRAQLLASYLPFFFVPLLMAADMALRVHRLAVAGARAEAAVKTR
jgi:hypothetical protein